MRMWCVWFAGSVSRMVNKAPRSALVLLAVSTVFAAGTVWFTSGILSGYGTTSGSAWQGAVDGLKFAAIPLLVVSGLAVAAFMLAKSAAWLRAAAAAVVALAVVGALVVGAQAALTRYGELAVFPDCLAGGSITGPAEPMLREAQDALSDLEHPGRFSGGSTGVDGCVAYLRNVTFETAETHYRDALPAAGWHVTHDEADRLRARSDGLVFVLAKDRPDPGTVTVSIKPVVPVAFPEE